MATLDELFKNIGTSVNTMADDLRNAELEKKMAVNNNLGAAAGMPLDPTRGVLNQLSGGRGDLVNQYVNQAIPLPDKADPWMAAFNYFVKLGQDSSQPGATLLGASTSALQAPMDYLNSKKSERTKAEQARAALGLQIAPSLKPKAATYRDPKEYMISMPVLDDQGQPTGQYKEAYQDYLTAPDFAKLQKQGARFTSVDKTTGAAGKINLNKYLDPSRIDDPTTKTINEQIIQLSPDEYQARMAANNPVYPLAATDSALIDPVDESLGIARKTVIYGNGTTLATYDSGSVLREGGSNDAVTVEDFDRVMNEARESGVIDTIRGAAAAEAGRSAVEIGVAAQKSIGQLTNSIELLKDARVLVDLPTGGANTGWLESKFPSVFASSIALDNIRSNLGLAVVGMNTFGALSEGELALALATALPNTMQEEELSQWISDKIVAQEKLRIHYAKAAEYLTDPLGGGISKWVEIQRNRFEVEQGEEARRAADVITNMSDEDFRTITAQDKMAMTTAELQAYLARLQGQ
jgi:acetolactate synthase regulatory subunit